MHSHTSRTRLPALCLLASSLPFGVSCSDAETGQSGQAGGNDFQEIVYTVRQHTRIDADGNAVVSVTEGMGQVMDYRRYVPGARIEVRNLASGATRNILSDAAYALADVIGIDLSFDARELTFSMRRGGDDQHYHIYTASLAARDGDYSIRQLTFGDRDDLGPIWLAGGKIAFVTNQAYTEMGTRADEYNHGRDVTQLAVITRDGGDADRKLCSQNLSHTVNLFSMQSGKIGYSRWEHLENVNDLKVFAANPDCTKMVAVAGQHEKFWNSLVQMQETKDQNVFVGIATSRENTIQAGALMRVDVRSAEDPTVLDKEKPHYELLTPGVPLDDSPSPSNVGRYRAPYVLPDGRLLVSWARGFVNDLDELSLSPPDFGLYIYNAETHANELIVNYEDSWELDGRPVLPRAEPPILSSAQTSADAALPARLGSVDIKQTSLFSLHQNTVSGAQFDNTSMDDALAGAVRVRIIEGFSSEAAPGAAMFGLTMAEGAALLGEAVVHEDGSWLADIPPYLPVHLQPIDEFDLMIRNQTTWIQAMPGESRVCGGCHERRTQPFRPSEGQLTLAAADPQDFTQPISERTEYPWDNANAGSGRDEIQALLSARCAACHNETQNGSGPQQTYTVSMTDEQSGVVTPYSIPRLDLSDRAITVTYDRDVQSWPASYVSLFYPATLEMEMGMGVELSAGAAPPVWARPSDARHSALIEKLNITAIGDASRTAWPLGAPFTNSGIQGGTRTLHPEDVGGSLSREERVKLIRAIDLGGQFYSRKNTSFEPMAAGQLQ
jgi:hydrazine synthase alpha subunit-like protein